LKIKNLKIGIEYKIAGTGTVITGTGKYKVKSFPTKIDKNS
jgi:protein-disulfide isomerase